MSTRFCLPYNVQLTLAENAWMMLQLSKLLMVFFGMTDSGFPVYFCSEVIIQVALVLQFRRSFTSGKAMLA
ncbi:hypothetical protein AML59_15955 [Escherichia coli]|nr:hypothetical protein AML59_15955 [Escherichia coli]